MSATIPSTMLLSDLLKATGYDCPQKLQGKTFDEATAGDIPAVLEENKAVSITENGTIEVTPSEGYEGMKKVTANVAVATGGLYNWTKDGTHVQLVTDKSIDDMNVGDSVPLRLLNVNTDATDGCAVTTARAFVSIVFKGKLYMCTVNDIYVSADGLVVTRIVLGYKTNTACIHNDKLYLGTSNGLYVSVDGETFTSVTNTFAGDHVFATSYKGKLYVGRAGQHSGLYVSEDGETFTQNTSFPASYLVFGFAIFGDKLYVFPASVSGSTTTYRGLYVSEDGATFAQNTSFPTTSQVFASGTFNGKFYVSIASGIYISEDGATFTLLSSSPHDIFAFVEYKGKLYACKGTLLSSSNAGGIYISEDGETFARDTEYSIAYTIYCACVFRDLLYIGNYNGCYIYHLPVLRDAAISSETDTVASKTTDTVTFTNNGTFTVVE